MVAHKKGKKKGKKSHSSSMSRDEEDNGVHIEIIDEESDYPTSRVIKRAPNGDVIVESLPESGAGSSEAYQQASGTAEDSVEVDSKWPLKLDTHWESLSLEERRIILRISKEELFDMIKSYKNVHSCDCSMCGRHNNVSIEQEMEHIYNELYEHAKEEDADTDFVQFHLKLIKEYQNSSVNKKVHEPKSPKGITQFDDENNSDDSMSSVPKQSKGNLIDCKNGFQNSWNGDSAVKYCLSKSHDDIDNLDDNDSDMQKQVETSDDSAQITTNKSSSSMNWKQEIEQFKHSKQIKVNDIMQDHNASNMESDNRASPSEADAKLFEFAQTFVSSHPQIAEEFINKALMYPPIRAMTEDMMGNKGEGLKKAMESWVTQQQDPENTDEQSLNNQSESDDIEAYSASAMEPKLLDATKLFKSNNKIRPFGPAEIDAFLTGMGFDFSEDSNTRDHIKKAFHDIMTNESRRLEISGASNEYKEELKRLRNEISAHEECEDSYESSDNFDGDDYEDERNDNEILEREKRNNDVDNDYVDDEDIDDHHLESDYSDDGDGEDSLYDTALDNNHQKNIHNSDLEHHHKNNHYNHNHSHHSHDRHHHHSHASEDDLAEDYNSEVDHAEKLEEGRRLIQIAITKILQKKLISSYQEKEAEKNRERLLMELEAEENQRKEKEKKKQKKKEKEKEKKRLQQQAKEEDKKRQEEEERRSRKEAEEKEAARREAQRLKVEEAKRKTDEKRRKKLEEQRRREEEQEHQRKLKEDIKRQREEELRQKKLEKEKKQLELQEKRVKRKIEDDQKLFDIQLNKDFEAEKSLDQSVKAVPYGVISHEILPEKSSVNDDIFNMINEASKSLSSSPSHPHDSNGINLASGSFFAPPPPGLSEISPHAQQGFTSLTGGLIPNGLPWENIQTSPSFYSNQQSILDSQSNLPPPANPVQFSSYTDTSVGIADEIADISNFLKDTNLNDVLIPPTSVISNSSVDGVNTSPRPQSVVYSQPSLWSNDSQRLPQFNSQPSGPSSTISSQPRRSIWDTSSGPAFAIGATTSTNYPNIWGTNSSSNNSNGIISQAVDNLPINDILAKTYQILSPDNSFILLDKLYQAGLAQVASQSAFSYSQFLSTLLSMKDSHNCELLNDNTGLLAYCRMGNSPIPSQGMSGYACNQYQQNNSQPAPQPQHQQHQQQHDRLTSVPGTSNVLFADVFSQPSSASVNQIAVSADPKSATIPESSSYLNFGPTFSSSYQTSNIWS